MLLRFSGLLTKNAHQSGNWLNNLWKYVWKEVLHCLYENLECTRNVSKTPIEK